VTIADDVIEAVTRHPAISQVRLVGSRAAGTANPFSDWDFKVETDDFLGVRRDIGGLLRPLAPLVEQWDRLSDTWCWMAIVPGPSKLDLIFDEPHEHEPPWQVSPATLDAIDRHFWDWALWLRSKQASGSARLVERELALMHEHILGPMGVESRPGSLDEAVRKYVSARNRLEDALDVSVPRALQHEVLLVLAGR
jgi:hypothetical protein